MGFNISEKMELAMSEILPGKWLRERMMYLGIRICSNDRGEYYPNHYVYVGKCRSWDIIGLFWLGGIAAVKMAPLP